MRNRSQLTPGSSFSNINLVNGFININFAEPEKLHGRIINHVLASSNEEKYRPFNECEAIPEINVADSGASQTTLFTSCNDKVENLCQIVLNKNPIFVIYDAIASFCWFLCALKRCGVAKRQEFYCLNSPFSGTYMRTAKGAWFLLNLPREMDKFKIRRLHRGATFSFA